MCSAGFDQKCHEPSARSSLFTHSLDFNTSDFLISFFLFFFFLVSLDEKVLKRKHFAYVEDVKQKMAEALKSLKIDELKN